MKKYNLHVITFKNLKINGKIKRQITEVKYYDKTNFELACYFAYIAGCNLRLLDKNGNVATKTGACKAIGYSEFDNVIAFINPIKRMKWPKFDMSIFPECSMPVGMNDKMVSWDRVNPLLEDHNNNFFDYSIDCNLFGAKWLIPKGYKHITEGLVKDGDYYWNYGHYVNCNVSFSQLKIGQIIKYRGVRFEGTHKGRVDNDIIDTWNSFIIRPINIIK